MITLCHNVGPLYIADDHNYNKNTAFIAIYGTSDSRESSIRTFRQSLTAPPFDAKGQTEVLGFMAFPLLDDTADETIGIELGSHITRVALMRHRAEGPHIVDLSSTPVGVKPVYTAKTEEQGKIFEEGLLTTSLSSDHVLLRTLEVPVAKPREVRAVATFQVEPQLPFSAEEASIQPVVLESRDGATRVAVYAAHSDSIKHHLEECEKAGIEPESVSCTPLALQAFVQFYLPSTEPLLVLHIGARNTTICLASPKGVESSYSVPIGSAALFAALTSSNPASAEAISTLLESDPLPAPSAEAAKLIDQLGLEIGRAMALAVRTAKDLGLPSPKKLLSTGDAVPLAPYLDPVAAKLGLSSINRDGGEQDGRKREFALPIGLALSSLVGAGPRLNLLPGDQTNTKSWKRLFQPFKMALAALAALTVLVFVFQKQSAAAHTHQLQERYSSALALAGLSPTEFEELYRKENRHLPALQAGETVDLSDLTPDQIASRAQFLDRRIEATPISFPLFPNVPRVSDVLGWLDTYSPFLDSEGQSLMRLQSFSYTLVKRPTKNRQRDPYQVKVEVEFATQTPTDARTVHDALVAPNPMIDQREDVKWTSSKGVYRASFILKDQTSYPR